MLPSEPPPPGHPTWTRLVAPQTKDELASHKEKRPRHRHSPAQLVALSRLFEETAHPSLEDRISLAREIGLETKAVNAWFQNKRASLAKKSSAAARQKVTLSTSDPYDLPPISSLLTEPPSDLQELDTPIEQQDETFEKHHSIHLDSPEAHQPASQDKALFGDFSSHLAAHSHLFESSAMPRKARLRPTAYQSEELRRLFEANPHPSKEQRELLGDRIGMRHQSVTNWFQNQRSVKRRKEGDDDTAQRNIFASPGPLPPATIHPSLQPSLDAKLPQHPTLMHPSFPVHASGPSKARSPPLLSQARVESANKRSISAPAPFMSSRLSEATTPEPRASDRTPTTMPIRRPRRSRPEPYQLDVLRRLFTRTQTPSIEERSAVAVEVGMDIGKVTNWFRNLRQTERKKAQRTGSDRVSRGSEDRGSVRLSSDEGEGESTFGGSRAGSPFFSSSSSMIWNEHDRYPSQEPMDIVEHDSLIHINDYLHERRLSISTSSSRTRPPQHASSGQPLAASDIEIGSEDDEGSVHEPYTPSPGRSPLSLPGSPPLSATVPVQPTPTLSLSSHLRRITEATFSIEVGKKITYRDVQDATLLLDFRSHIEAQ